MSGNSLTQPSALGVACLVACAPLVLAIIAMIPVLASDEGGACGDAFAGQPAESSLASQNVPPTYLRLYMQTGRRYKIPWTILAAIGQLESDHGRYPGPGIRTGANPKGAAGPMQIGVGGAAGDSWTRRRVDGNNDGKMDVHDPADAIPTAARILISDKGFRKSHRTAVRRYNGSGRGAEAYADKAMALAKRYGTGPPADYCTGITAGGLVAPKGRGPNGAWEAETMGPDRITPRMRQVRDLIRQQFDVPRGIGCYRTTGDPQDHAEGRACDFMISAGSPNWRETQLGIRIANWAAANANELGINYVIFRQRIWNIERSRKGWRPMSDRGTITANHFDHVHISVY